MKFGFGLYSVLLLVLIFQILIFSVLIVKDGISNSRNSPFLLSFLLLLLSMYVAPFMFGYAGWYGLDGYREVLFYIPFQHLFLIGPICLFYIKSLLKPSYQWQTTDYLHLLPALFYLVYTVYIAVYDLWIADQIYFYSDGRDRDLDLWYQFAGYLSLLVYFGLSIKVYLSYKKRIFEEYSYADEITYDWIRNFLLAFLFILVLRGLFFVLNPEWGEFGRKFWYYLSISIISYYVAISGYRQGIMSSLSFYFQSNSDIEPKILITTSKESGNTDHELMGKIDRLMQEKELYKNSLLTLTDLAEKLQVTSRTISRVINSSTELNFNDYVNHYRIENVLKEIDSGSHQKQTILGIAMSSGFNSKSTFNRSFKKQVGCTPYEYIKKQIK